jgi:hypothetical protein
MERVRPKGRVAEAGCKAEERTITLGGGFVRIASVRWRPKRASRRGERKPCESEHERDKKETAP